MKYTKTSPPLICLQTTSTCYQRTHKMEVYGVLWHSTGANNPYISRYVQPSDNAPDRDELLAILGKNRYNNDWNHEYREAGLNAWVGKLTDGSVASVQSMPWDFAPWGCGVSYKGGPSCNSHWVQFEICEDNLKDEDYFNQVYREACELTAYICKLYNIDPQGAVKFQGKIVPTILCHQDSYLYGLGSNHGDIYHWFKVYGKTMQTVRDDVEKLLLASGETYVEEDIVMPEKRYNSVLECPEYTRKTVIKMIDKGYIGGTGTGKKDSDGRPADLELSIDMLRVFTVLDRAGVFDNGNSR